MKRYILVGLVVFLGVLVVTFPARVAYNWFAPSDMQLTGISGSVWNGKAVEALAAGAFIQDITWKLKPASIFSGQLAFATSGKPASGSLTSDVAVSLTGSLILSNIFGNVPLDMVHPAFQQNGISGDVTLGFSSLIIRDGLPIEANGNITITNMFAPNLSSARLGDYKADFQTADEKITATVVDLSGVLDVSGTITLSPDRSYQLIGEVGALPGAPPSVVQQLQFLGSADQRGFRPFRFEGSL